MASCRRHKMTPEPNYDTWTIEVAENTESGMTYRIRTDIGQNILSCLALTEGVEDSEGLRAFILKITIENHRTNSVQPAVVGPSEFK